MTIEACAPTRKRAPKSQCSASRPDGSRCQRTATSGETCARHAPGYVAPKRAPRKAAPVAVEPRPFAPVYMSPVERPDEDDFADERAGFHALRLYEHTCKAGACVRMIEAGTDDEPDVRADLLWHADRIEGHAIRAFVALLEWALADVGPSFSERIEAAHREVEHSDAVLDETPPAATPPPASKRTRKPRAAKAAPVYVEPPRLVGLDLAGRHVALAREYSDAEREDWRDQAIEMALVHAATALLAYGLDVEAFVPTEHPEEHAASAVSPEAHRPVVEGPEGAACADACAWCLDDGCAGTACRHTSAPVEHIEPPALLVSERGCDVWRASWRELAVIAEAAGGVDAVIVDAPYSERTHTGHDGADRNDGSGVAVRGDASYGHREKTRGLCYPAWTPDDVAGFVTTWAPLCRGWLVTITDDVLAPVWRSALEDAGRYAFAPLPLVSVGSTVRLVGDGPCSWTCWIVVSRPRSGEWLAAWRDGRRAASNPCALPGAYVYTGHGDRQIMGGKTLGAMRALVRDYTRPGDLVCDPCAGAGTTGVAAIAEGRRALLGDVDATHAALAAERVRSLPQAPKRGTLALDWGST